MHHHAGDFMTSKSIALSFASLLFLARPVAAADGPLDCLIEPSMTVSVASPVDAVLDKVLVDRGDLVRKGQVIAQLESSVEKINVALARSHLDVESPMRGNQARLDFGVR